jgi:hypothetical protein
MDGTVKTCVVIACMTMFLTTTLTLHISPRIEMIKGIGNKYYDGRIASHKPLNMERRETVFQIDQFSVRAHRHVDPALLNSGHNLRSLGF